MKELIKNALVLCGITVVAGILLGAVYEITKEPRERQQEISKTNAYREVLKEAAEFKDIDIDSDIIKKLLKEYGITEQNVVVDSCVTGLNKNDEIAGYIVSVTSKEGYGGNISFSVGFSSEGNITGVSVLSISETAGLGMNAKEEEFLSQYKVPEDGLFVVNKTESEEGINIDAISGATITTNAMTKGVNAAKITAIYLLTEYSDSGDTEVTESENESVATEGGEVSE